MIQSTFLPGGTCLYYRVYCSSSYSDIFIIKRLTPFLNSLGNKIKYWFFIRYNDSHFGQHLRIRLFVSEDQLPGVWQEFHQFFVNEQAQTPIKNIEMGTYQRELLRYGANRIELIERLWSFESSLLTHVLEKTNNNEYIIFCILVARTYLLEFYSQDDLIHKHIANRTTYFYNEFNLGKVGRKELGVKYKLIENDLLSAHRSKDVFIKKYSQYNQMLNLINEINGTLNSDDKGSVVSSILHMFFNRCFYSDQRLMEMVCYHHLNRFNLKLKYGKV